MATTPEGKVKAEIRMAIAQFDLSRGEARGLAYADSWTYWPVNCGMGRSGVPDVIGTTTDGVRLMAWAIEAKARVTGSNSDGPTALQIDEIKRMRACGHKVCVIGLRPGENARALRQRVFEILCCWWNSVDAVGLYDYEHRLTV